MKSTEHIVVANDVFSSVLGGFYGRFALGWEYMKYIVAGTWMPLARLRHLSA